MNKIERFKIIFVSICFICCYICVIGGGVFFIVSGLYSMHKTVLKNTEVSDIDESRKNLIEMQSWIDKAKKPIKVGTSDSSYLNGSKYTLISADSKIYESKKVTVNLPEILR